MSSSIQQQQYSLSTEYLPLISDEHQQLLRTLTRLDYESKRLLQAENGVHPATLVDNSTQLPASLPSHVALSLPKNSPKHFYPYSGSSRVLVWWQGRFIIIQYERHNRSSGLHLRSAPRRTWDNFNDYRMLVRVSWNTSTEMVVSDEALRSF